MEDAQKRKERYERNKAKILEKAKLNYQLKKEEIKEKTRNYHHQNREKVLERKRNYHNTNKEECNKRSKEYRENNKEEISIQRKEYREKNKDFIRESRKKYREKHKEILKENAYLRKYKINFHTYNNMLEEQNFCCAICGLHKDNFSKMLAVDHDHDTGKVRSLLCSKCNCGLGNFKDNVENLQNALNYLIKHKLKEIL